MCHFSRRHKKAESNQWHQDFLGRSTLGIWTLFWKYPQALAHSPRVSEVFYYRSTNVKGPSADKSFFIDVFFPQDWKPWEILDDATLEPKVLGPSCSHKPSAHNTLSPRGHTGPIKLGQVQATCQHYYFSVHSVSVQGFLYSLFTLSTLSFSFFCFVTGCYDQCWW